MIKFKIIILIISKICPFLWYRFFSLVKNKYFLSFLTLTFFIYVDVKSNNLCFNGLKTYVRSVGLYLKIIKVF